jgi:hypothetical protein
MHASVASEELKIEYEIYVFLWFWFVGNYCCFYSEMLFIVVPEIFGNTAQQSAPNV